MAWKDYKTDLIISDEEFEEECENCRGFASMAIYDLLPCNDEKCECPYYRRLEE